MKKSLDVLVWALLLFLITPSGMALASWNAVPGDYTYAWKLSLEKVLLWALSPSDTLQSSTQVKIAERRFSEVEQVLDSEYAVESLDNLNKQLNVTTTDIQKISKDTARDEVTEQYIVSLKKMSATLDEQKTKAQTGEIAVVPQKTTSSTKPTSVAKTTSTPAKPITSTKTNTAPTNLPEPTDISANDPVSAPITVPTAVPSSTPTNAINPTANPAPAPTENAEEVVEKIDETKKNIEEKIKELERIRQQNENRNSNREDEFESNNRNQNNQNNNNRNERDEEKNDVEKLKIKK